MMDDRTRRLGQHTAQTTPAWAIQRPRPGPRRSAARRDWEHKAASIAAYREMYGYDHPGDPIGPEPSHASTGPAGRLAPGVRRPRPGRPAGRPGHARRAAVARSATPTPPRPPGHPATPGRSCGCPGSAPSTPPWAPSAPTPKPTPPARPATTTAPRGTSTWPPATGPCATTTSSKNRTFTQAMADRQEWEHATADPGAWPSPPTPNCAAATPTGKIEPLRSAEPAPVSDAERQHPDLTPQQGSQRERP